MDAYHIIIFIFSLLIMMAGLSGIILPIIPSTPLIWFGILIYAVFDGFEGITRLLLLIFAALTALSLVLDYFGGIIGARKFGATKWGVIGSIIGSIGGFLAGGIIGLIMGPFLGAVLFEILFGKDFRTAFKSGVGTIVGFLGGTISKLVIGVIMIGIFIWKVF
jgi:uncharacterized protein